MILNPQILIHLPQQDEMCVFMKTDGGSANTFCSTFCRLYIGARGRCELPLCCHRVEFFPPVELQNSPVH